MNLLGLICFGEISLFSGFFTAEDALPFTAGLIQGDAAQGSSGIFLDLVFVFRIGFPPYVAPTVISDDLFELLIILWFEDVLIAELGGFLEAYSLESLRAYPLPSVQYWLAVRKISLHGRGCPGGPERRCSSRCPLARSQDAVERRAIPIH